MRQNPVAENVLGTMGTICWTGQLIPQVWKNYKDKKTVGLSPWLMLIWGISSAFLGVYAILQDLNIPLQIQPQLFGFLALLSWGQCLYYDPRRQDKKRFSVLIVVGTMILVGALQVMLVFVSRPAYERGISIPVKLYGILSVVLIASGLIPQYWEIYRFGEVKGLSYTFICIDTLGGVLNDLSLVFASNFDGLAAATYTAVAVMDSVIIFAALILNPRARKRRRLAVSAVSAASEESFEANAVLDISTHGSSERVHTREVIPGGGVNLTRSTTLHSIIVVERAGLDDNEKTDGVNFNQNGDRKGGDRKSCDPPLDVPNTARTRSNSEPAQTPLNSEPFPTRAASLEGRSDKNDATRMC